MAQGKSGEEKPKTKVDAMEETLLKLIDMVEANTTRIDKIERTTVKKSAGLFGGKREKTAIRDTKTGKIYPSKASVGKNLAGEFDLDALDHFAWYKIQSAAPVRFVPASDEEAQKVWKEEEEVRAKEMEEANKKLAEEQAKESKK